MNAPAEPMTEAAGPVPHVLTAINAVMAEIAQEGIAKNRNNSQQNYRFRGIDDVYNALAPLLAKHKLIITPKGLGRTCEERQSKSGSTLFYVNVEAEYELCSALDGTTKVAGPFYGEAMDSADKATNKAQSAAYKYMAMQQFCIPTEGDNDADGQTHEVAPRARAEPQRVAPASRPAPPKAAATTFAKPANTPLEAFIAAMKMNKTLETVDAWATREAKSIVEKLDFKEQDKMQAAYADWRDECAARDEPAGATVGDTPFDDDLDVMNGERAA